MSLWEKITGEFIDIIEWLDESNDTIVYRFERYNNEIKYGAKLVVRPSQVAVFVNEGADKDMKTADLFEAGTHELQTKNLPVLSTLKGWKYGFESPFKAEVYFVSMRKFTNQKWGTMNPIIVRDPEFGAVRIRGNGAFDFQVQDPKKLIQTVTGTDSRFQAGEIHEQLRNVVIARFTDLLAEAKIPAFDLTSKQDELADMTLKKIAPEFSEYGLEVTKFLINNLTLPPEVESALDKRASMGIIGNLNAYTQYQAGNAMEAAANNPSGGAAAGMGMGMGVMMAGQMAQGGQASGPPPLPQADLIYIAVNGQKTGPFDLASLTKQIQGGSVTAETLVWKQGMANWAKAKDLPELAAQFSGPPPIPQG